MEYNLKIKDYQDDVQVSYYEKKIKRKDGKQNEDDTRTYENRKRNIRGDIQATWNNPKTGKIEVIPEGFQVIEHPFEKYLMLYPEDRFIDEDVWVDMEYEKMLPIVEKKLAEEKERKCFANDMRSFRRTRQNVYEIARGSNWELFVTLTIADEYIRNNLDEAKKRVSKRINNIKNQKGLNFKYILIAERHPTSGAWHFHGLFKEISGLKLTKAINPHTGQKIIKNGMTVYNMPDFDTIGFTTATFVQNNARVVKYILKYVTKEMIREFPREKNLSLLTEASTRYRSAV